MFWLGIEILLIAAGAATVCVLLVLIMFVAYIAILDLLSEAKEARHEYLQKMYQLDDKVKRELAVRDNYEEHNDYD